MLSKKNLILLVQLFLTIIIVALLLASIDVHLLLSVLFQSKLEFVFLAICAYLVVDLLNTYKLQRLVKSSELSFRDIFLIHMAGMLASDVTPGRSGYLYTILLLKRKVRGSLSAAAIAVFQLSEILIKIVGSIVGFMFVFSIIVGSDLPAYFFVVLLILVLAFSFAFVILFSDRILTFVNLVDSWAPSYLKISKRFTDLQKNAKKMKSELPMATAITALAWFFKGMEWFFIAMALEIPEINLMVAFMLHPLVSAFALVPVSLAGLGVMESAAILIFGGLGVTAEKVVAFALLGRAVDLFTDLIGIKGMVRA
jgi:uncharacterized protein (TIRG00374 family)